MAKKTDFDYYKILRLEGLNDYSQLAGEKLEVTPKRIKEEFYNILKTNRRYLLFAIDNESIVGYLIGSILKANYQHKRAYIDDLYIKKEYRRRGYAQKLMNRFIELMKNKGITKVQLGVRINNKPAISLYKKLGFKIKHYEMEKDIVSKAL